MTFSVYRAYWLIDSVGSSYMTSAATTSAFLPISFLICLSSREPWKFREIGIDVAKASVLLPDVWYATGFGGLGVTLTAAVGRLGSNRDPARGQIALHRASGCL